ncbi:MAG: tRNA (N6-isopentenyl adenosine(37)-C2)-methylthiotransferase MiaB [Alphaproteobacteria bacterium]
MNVYDSERMAESLIPHGYAPVDSPEAAALVLLNTCHIREKAAEKVYSEIGRLAKLRRQRQAAGEDMMIAVVGCVAQAEGQEMLARAPAVDIVLGPQTYHRLPEMVARARRDRDARPAGAAAGAGLIDTDFPAEDKFDALPAARQASGVTAFLTIQEGCDKFCTFCVVPYTRGAEASRPAAAVLAEARDLVAAGVREITLLGQNVNAYHGAAADGGGVWSLARLVRGLARIEGLDRIRYTTSHPRDMSDELILCHKEETKLMPYLHLPVQQGSDSILKAMNRRHSRDDYLRVIERLRQARPDMALTSDFIVGFPGESEDDFAATLDLVERVGFAGAFSFKYSPRPGTPAAIARGQVAEPVKDERLARLQALLHRQEQDFNAATVGRTVAVLFDRVGRHAGQLVGRSPWLQPVHVTAPHNRLGGTASVVITDRTSHGLIGRLRRAVAVPASPAVSPSSSPVPSPTPAQEAALE